MMFGSCAVGFAWCGYMACCVLRVAWLMLRAARWLLRFLVVACCCVVRCTSNLQHARCVIALRAQRDRAAR